MKLILLAVIACGPPVAAPTGNHTVANPSAISDSTLAVFEPDHDACVLRRFDPVARTSTELGRFPTACFGARISWRADLSRALVWFDPDNLPSGGYGATGAPAPGHADEHVQITEQRFELDLATHAITSIAPPHGDRAVELAYGLDGSLLAFAERDLPKAKGVVTVEGRILDFTQIQEGLPAAAITYRHDGDAWTLVSVAATTTGWDYARGWSASPEAVAGIGPRSNFILAAHADTKEIVDPATRRDLDQIAPSQPDGDGWAQLAKVAVYVWMFNAEFVSTTGRIAWRRLDGSIAVLPDLGFTGGELISITSRGRYLLVAGSNTGTFPRLYDVVDRKRVYASETARAITFWPAP